MTPGEASKVVESLRKGIPPDGHVRHFTVGRTSETSQLLGRLEQQKSGPLLLHANFGAGKSHLLRFIREAALEQGFAISWVELDAKSAVRFNRMDQILGAICRGIEIPGCTGERGVRSLFNLACKSIEEHRRLGAASSFWHEMTNGWEWDFSEAFDAPAMFIALRAWRCGGRPVQDLIEDWMFQPWNYRSQRKQLYLRLVEDLRRYFRDPRADWQFYADDIFRFDPQAYQQSWAMLRDIETMCLESGLKGFIILFDEFEKALVDLNNIKYQEAAFWNLFQFYSGKQFSGMTYFAVTPEFVHRCKTLLLQSGRWDYDYSRFDKLPSFEMSPLSREDMELLAGRIADAHGVAYGWQPLGICKPHLTQAVRQSLGLNVPDRTRQAIRAVVTALDRLLEDGQ